MKITITRHGETEENKLGIIQGHLPGKLSQLGINQAKKIALRLKDEKIDFIYSSDLARASDTAKEIIKFHPNTPVKFIKNLREKFLGEWQGKTKEELGFPKEKSVSEIFPKDGERTDKLFDRANIFLNKILLEHNNSDNILFVGHNGINRAIIAVITQKKPEEIKLIERQHNANISIFEIDKNKNYKIKIFNSTKHLD